MSGALLQIVAFGAEDLYLTASAQISFFTTVIRTHTNFIIESTRNEFSTDVKFDKKVSITLEKKGDLVSKTYLQVELPKLKPLTDGVGIKAEAILENKTNSIIFLTIYTTDIIYNGSGFEVSDIYTLEPLDGTDEITGSGNGINGMIQIDEVDEEGSIIEFTLISAGFDYDVGEIYKVGDIEPAYLIISSTYSETYNNVILITNGGTGYFFQPKVIIEYGESKIEGLGIIENGSVVDFDIVLPQECVADACITIIGGQLVNTIAWSKNIGHTIIEYVEIIIGGQIIDKQYGEWLHLWSELTIPNKKKEGYNKMIGNVPQLYTPSTVIDSRTLYIPLQFWFCRDYSLAIPQVALKNSDIKFNVKFRKVEECIVLGPGFFVEISFVSVPITFNVEVGDEITLGDVVATIEINDINENSTSLYFQYFDKRESSRFVLGDIVIIGGEEVELITEPIEVPKTVYELPDSFIALLYTDLIYLDTDERNTFTTTKLEYLIEQVQFLTEIEEIALQKEIKFVFEHPCKELIWVVQSQENIDKNNFFEYPDGIINTAGLELVGYDRFSKREAKYFNVVQPYEKHTTIPSNNIFVYSFGLKPEDIHPSGTLNMSRLDLTRLTMTFDDFQTNYPLTFNIYGLNYNILGIADGLGGLLFNSN